MQEEENWLAFLSKGMGSVCLGCGFDAQSGSSHIATRRIKLYYGRTEQRLGHLGKTQGRRHVRVHVSLLESSVNDGKDQLKGIPLKYQEKRRGNQSSVLEAGKLGDELWPTRQG